MVSFGAGYIRTLVSMAKDIVRPTLIILYISRTHLFIRTKIKKKSMHGHNIVMKLF